MRRITDSKACVHCGGLFFKDTRVSRVYWASRKFCGHSCEAEFRRTDRSVVFMDRCIPEPNSGCWLWLGQVNDLNGYGYFWDGHAHGLSHVFSYRMHKGVLPDKMWVLHHCDNKVCVNPEHLYAGLPVNNGGDMVRRGRSLFGERQPASKLTESQVISIINSSEPSDVLAERYGVGDGHIWSIRTRKAWKYLDRKESK